MPPYVQPFNLKDNFDTITALFTWGNFDGQVIHWIQSPYKFSYNSMSDQNEKSNIFLPYFLWLYCTAIFTRNQTKIYQFVKYVGLSLARKNYLRLLFCIVEHWDDYFLTLESSNRFNFT